MKEELQSRAVGEVRILLNVAHDLQGSRHIEIIRYDCFKACAVISRHGC